MRSAVLRRARNQPPEAARGSRSSILQPSLYLAPGRFVILLLATVRGLPFLGAPLLCRRRLIDDDRLHNPIVPLGVNRLRGRRRHVDRTRIGRMHGKSRRPNICRVRDDCHVRNDDVRRRWNVDMHRGSRYATGREGLCRAANRKKQKCPPKQAHPIFRLVVAHCPTAPLWIALPDMQAEVEIRHMLAGKAMGVLDKFMLVRPARGRYVTA